jgi:uncharacterized protein YfaT (DUF1175 family)
MNTSINAQTIEIVNPRFSNDINGAFLGQILNTSFGWFRTLDKEQKEAYHSSMILALEDAQPGEFARWYKNDASGTVRVAWQELRTNGICKRLHISLIAYNTIKNIQTTACFNEVDNRWSWYN